MKCVAFNQDKISNKRIKHENKDAQPVGKQLESVVNTLAQSLAVRHSTYK